MGFAPYPPEVEQAMKCYYDSLSEKDRRRYAAVEALKLGRGGIKYVASVMNCSYRTIATGIQELESKKAIILPAKIRREGAGRKSAWDVYPELDRKFLLIVTLNEVKFRERRHSRQIRLCQREIVEKLQEMGINVTRTVVRKLMAKHNVHRYNERPAPFPLKLQVI
jgi:transposase